MLDDTTVGSTWRGRPERDYVPPGGMKRYDEDPTPPQVAKPNPFADLPPVPSTPAIPEPSVTAPRTKKLVTRSTKERSYTPAWEAERMTCDACGSNQLKCVDSRPEPEGRFRRYKCKHCGASTITREVKLK